MHSPSWLRRLWAGGFNLKQLDSPSVRGDLLNQDWILRYHCAILPVEPSHACDLKEIELLIISHLEISSAGRLAWQEIGIRSSEYIAAVFGSLDP